MPDRTPLEQALAEACAFAIAHGVDTSITPADFAIQRSEPGLTTATHVNASHAVTATVDRSGAVRIAVAELFWVHDEADEDRDLCDYCEVIDAADFADRPLITVYLPGDAPAEVSANA